MTCRIGTNVIVCGPPPGVYRRTIRHCSECNRRHRFIERWDGAWYGSTLYGSCGDTWQDGWRFERPFARGWRAKRVREFRRMWESATTPRLYERYVRADVDFAVGDDDAWEAAANRRAAIQRQIDEARP